MKNRRKSIDKKIIFTNMIFNFFKTLSNSIFPLITFSYASRVLGNIGIGKVNFAKAVVSYFVILATLGIKLYGVREVAKRRDNAEALNSFVQEMLIFNACTILFSYILLVVSCIFIVKLHDYTALIIINSVAIALNGLGIEWLYQGLEEYKYISIRAIVFQFIALILMLLLVRNESDVIEYAFVNVLSTSGSFVLNFVYAKRFVSLKKVGHYKLKKHIRPILWLFAMAVSIELYTTLDTTMLGFLQNDAAVGRYTVAVRINKIVCTLVVSLGAVLSPRIAYSLKKKKNTEANDLIRKAYQIVFLFAIPSSAGLFCLSNELILILCGNKFIGSAVTMRILTLLVIIIPFNTITNGHIFISLGKEKLIVIGSIAGAVVNFVLNLLLIPRYAENGAAIATVLSEGTVALISIVNVKRNIDSKMAWKNMWQYFIAAVSIFAIYYFTYIFSFNAVLRTFFCIIAGAVSYFSMLLVFKNEYVVEGFRKIAEKIR